MDRSPIPALRSDLLLGILFLFFLFFLCFTNYISRNVANDVPGVVCDLVQMFFIAAPIKEGCDKTYAERSCGKRHTINVENRKIIRP